MSITARDTRSVAISELDILRCFMSRMPGRSTSTSAGSSWWLLLLLIPFVALLWVPFYNRLDPALFGIPFFYWYQFVWVILTSLIILLVDSRTREVDAADRDDQP
jgi:Protein of unknown function (DUF3311)